MIITAMKPTLAFLLIIVPLLVLHVSSSDADDHLDDPIASTPGSWFNGLLHGHEDGVGSDVSTDASEINLDADATHDPSIDLEGEDDEAADNATSPQPWYHNIFGLGQGQEEEESTQESVDRVVRSAEDTTSSNDQDANFDGIDDLSQANQTETNGTDPFNFASTAPTSTFNCENRKFGYYADVGRNCTIYHLCNPVTLPNSPDLVYQRISFLCVQNSTFDQMTLSCTRQPQIACSISPDYYESSNLSIRRSASEFNQHHDSNQVDDDDSDDSDDDDDEDQDDETDATTSHDGLMSRLFGNRRRR